MDTKRSTDCALPRSGGFCRLDVEEQLEDSKHVLNDDHVPDIVLSSVELVVSWGRTDMQ